MRAIPPQAIVIPLRRVAAAAERRKGLQSDALYVLLATTTVSAAVLGFRQQLLENQSDARGSSPPDADRAIHATLLEDYGINSTSYPAGMELRLIGGSVYHEGAALTKKHLQALYDLSAVSQAAFREPSELDLNLVRVVSVPANLQRFMPAGKAEGAQSLLQLLDAGVPLEEVRKLDPGLRVEPNFVDEEEERRLCEVIEKEVLTRYGFDFSKTEAKAQGTHVRVDGPGGNRREEIELARCTGRTESRNDRVAPWGYGKHLDESKLPKELKAVADKIRALNGYKLGKLRDVSINMRTKGYFYLSPHVDPLTDGPHVFVLGLQSATVITFTPDSAFEEAKANAGAPAAKSFAEKAKSFVGSWGGLKQKNAEVEKEAQEQAGGPGGSARLGRAAEERSWTDADLDVLFRKRALCGFTGAARYLWRHGIRSGLEVDDAAGKVMRLDFWGDMKNVVQRRDDRISIVCSFADADEL